MALIASLALLLILSAGLGLMVGFRETAKKLLVWVVVLLVVVPIGFALCGTVVQDVTDDVNEAGGGLALLVGVLLVAGVVLLVAWVRFVNHRRALTRWLGSRPTSQKRRMERD